MPRLVPPVIAAGAMSGITQPEIDIDGALALRAWRRSDAGAVVDAFSDPDIRRWHRFGVDEQAEAERWIEQTHAGWRAETSGNWAVVNAKTVLGRVGLHTDLSNGIAEIAYWMLPMARRRRVATRAVMALTRWAHEEIGFHRVELQHSTQNDASCRVARSAGFVEEGTLLSRDLHADGWHDMHQHAHWDASHQVTGPREL